MNPISIVVVTYNAPQALDLCLKSVLRHTKKVPFNLIVMDNGSEKATRSLLETYRRFSNVYIYHLGRNLGKAAALNRAVKLHPAPWYVFLDDDAIVPTQWLSKLLAAAKEAKPSPAIVGCRSNFLNGRIFSAEMIFWRDGMGRGEQDLGQRNYSRFCDSIVGTCMLVRDDVFSKVRFCERLGQQYEDADFCLEARRHGWFVYYCGEIAVRHQHLFRDGARHLKKNLPYIRAKWGFPSFIDSHPLDKAYVGVSIAFDGKDWEKVIQEGRALGRIDPVPAYSSWMVGRALLQLKRPAQASLEFKKALAERCLPDRHRAMIGLSYAFTKTRRRFSPV